MTLSIQQAIETMPLTTGLALPDDLPFEDWAELGEGLTRVEANLMWVVGDWLLFGHEHYGEARANTLAAATGLAEKTVWNATSVCRRVPLDARRQELSFGHHEAIAAQPSAIQGAWLQQAIDEGLSVHALRERVAAARAPKALPDVGKPRRLPVRFNVTAPTEIPESVFQEGVHEAAQTLHRFLAKRGYETDIAEVL